MSPGDIIIYSPKMMDERTKGLQIENISALSVISIGYLQREGSS